MARLCRGLVTLSVALAALLSSSSSSSAFAAAGSVPTTSSSSSSSSSSSTSTTTAAPGLLPPLDLSAAGVEAFLKELLGELGSGSGSGSGSLLPGLEEPLAQLVAVIGELLQAVEGLLLPQQQQQQLQQLTASLRSVVSQQNLISSKLHSLQQIAAEGPLAANELLSLQAIADRLLQQFKNLEAAGLQLLQQLKAFFQNLLPDKQQQQQQQQQDQQQQQQPDKGELELQTEHIMRAARTLFPDIIN
ncbi:hypothetical protein, conserved [Eimeria tenella]|uniref:Uncharacterized protein n=1 Tax=Eimeria tenella TaxID=5802 RepID=U6KNW2_EIMTE|nr:hypothetical protein, conserved [Eimeria tenella]CDJ37952.1 hypothetical protein, conserved [Eimeria tenella]|eukprot:XP_013228790.1 hypothetical protein, conserved [Eimeria tenella]